MGTQFLSPGTPGLEPLPLERGARRLVQRAPSVEAPQLRRRLARTPVWPGFEKHNLVSGILAQARGEHAPGAAAADDDPSGLDRRPHLVAHHSDRTPAESGGWAGTSRTTGRV